MEFTAILQKFNSSLWGYHINIPDEIAQFFLEKETRRTRCILNKTVIIQAALMPNGQGSYFINLNKETRTKLNLQIGEGISVKLEEDTSKYGIPFPEEMEELLNQDEEGNKWFHSLTPGKQRSLLYVIAKPKSSEIRLRKALTILEYIKATQGNIDFSELTQVLKVNK